MKGRKKKKEGKETSFVFKSEVRGQVESEPPERKREKEERETPTTSERGKERRKKGRKKKKKKGGEEIWRFNSKEKPTRVNYSNDVRGGKRKRAIMVLGPLKEKKRRKAPSNCSLQRKKGTGRLEYIGNGTGRKEGRGGGGGEEGGAF